MASLIGLVVMLFVSGAQATVIPDVHFRRLDTRHGLSNSQVNCILRDSRGYVWLATPYGLNRFDGYRVRNLYSYDKDTTTMTSNRVDMVEEDSEGRLWLYHGMSYSVYDPVTERVDRNPSLWLNRLGVPGNIEHVHIDSKKNFWIKTIDDGFVYLNPKTKKVTRINFGYGPTEFPKEFGITAYSESKQGMIVVSSQGELMCIDGEKGKVLWKEDYVKKAFDAYAEIGVYVDGADNYWVIPRTKSLFIYRQKEKRWYTSLPEMMKANGFTDVPDEIQVWDVRYDNKGLLWVATDHLGILIIDFKTREWRQFTNVKGDETSVPDITNKHLYFDQLGRMWVATYKNGVAMCSWAMSNFANLAVGDINAVCEDHDGYYWLGHNDGGIQKMDPKTYEILETYNKENLGLRSDIIVSASVMRDGSLWFGTYDGGVLKYRNGKWHNYLASDPGSAMANNNVWSVCEDKWGNVWLGMLGGGLVRIDRATGKQRVFNADNSELSTIWTNNIQSAPNGWILTGNSEYYSMINPGNFQIENGSIIQDGNTYTIATATQQAYMDSRGLIWLGSASGAAICNPKTHHTKLLDMKSGLLGSNVVSVVEDQNHTMWVVTDHGVSNIVVQKQSDGELTFNIRSFNDRDGLQPGPFNQRAIWCTRDGKLLIGGQDGVDIINTKNLAGDTGNERPVFSGLLVFEQEVPVGREFNGHVILDEPIDMSREVTLRYSENQFTIQMASDDGGVGNGTRFIYMLKGFNDQWIRTNVNNPNISYTSLPSGSYTLCVRMLNPDGTMGKVESQLQITIKAPWYRSWWAYLCYVIILAAVLYWRREVISFCNMCRREWNGWLLRLRQKKAAENQKPKADTEKNDDDDVEEAVLMDDDENGVIS